MRDGGGCKPRPSVGAAITGVSSSANRGPTAHTPKTPHSSGPSPPLSVLESSYEERVHGDHRASRRRRILGPLPRGSRGQWPGREFGRGASQPCRGDRTRARGPARRGAQSRIIRLAARNPACWVKKVNLLRHLTLHGCQLLREGRSHSVWVNPTNGARETVPRHSELKDQLARHICRRLGIPDPPG